MWGPQRIGLTRRDYRASGELSAMEGPAASAPIVDERGILTRRHRAATRREPSTPTMTPPIPPTAKPSNGPRASVAATAAALATSHAARIVAMPGRHETRMPRW